MISPSLVRREERRTHLGTDRQNQSQFSDAVRPEWLNTAHSNVLDWREASSGEASILSEVMLLSAARAGQEWAFVELCSRYSKRILFMLHRITKNREDAEDALQESMLKAFVHLGEFNQASSFGTWFTRIGINCAVMLLRRKRARPEISTDAPVDEIEKPRMWEIADRGPSPEEIFIQLENQQRLQTAISRLPKGYRHIVESRHRSDSTMKETAEEAGITIAAAKSRLLRATHVLRRSMLK
jgi:RNA polymerase sigma-70 factor (ECF subfamily)